MPGSEETNAANYVERHLPWIAGMLGCLALGGGVAHGIKVQDADALTLGWLGSAIGIWILLPLLRGTAPFLRFVKSIHIGQFQIDLQDIKRELGEVKASTDTAVTIATGGIGGVERGRRAAAIAEQDLDKIDPQRGRWGGQAVRSGRRLSATVNRVRNDNVNFRVRLTVSSIDDDRPLSGIVVFHLHPSFKPTDVQVPVREGKATLERIAWGAFTVGAEADDGLTDLELDLSTLPDAPQLFRER